MFRKREKNTAGSKKKRGGQPILLILELVFAAVALFSLYKIGSILMGYYKSAKGYESIRAEVMHPTSDDSDSAAQDGERQPVDFDLLQEKYPGAVGWLYCEDTVIDYPVMQAKDNDYFLRRLPNGEWNIGGSLFLDYRSQSDFLGPLSLIYGHNMNDDSMFTLLEKYTDQEWYDQHPAFVLETPQQTFTLFAVYGFYIPAQEWVDSGYDLAGNRQAMVQYAASHSTFVSETGWDGQEPIIALITCADYSDQDRYILLCVPRAEE